VCSTGEFWISRSTERREFETGEFNRHEEESAINVSFAVANTEAPRRLSMKVQVCSEDKGERLPEFTRERGGREGGVETLPQAELTRLHALGADQQLVQRNDSEQIQQTAEVTPKPEQSVLRSSQSRTIPADRITCFPKIMKVLKEKRRKNKILKVISRTFIFIFFF
jgi:hypothetical protein